MTSFGRISEDLLLRAHGGPMRTEACACGGFVGAQYGREAEAVAAHNTSELHQLWRAWMSLIHEAPGPDVLVISPSPGQLEIPA